MAESDISSPVFRSTSLTIRRRLTPASACSTRTRIRPSFRLVRFSAAVSSPPRGFFFRLAGLVHCWLVSLEADVLVQKRAWRVADLLSVSNCLVRQPSLVAQAEEFRHDNLQRVGLQIDQQEQQLGAFPKSGNASSS